MTAQFSASPKTDPALLAPLLEDTAACGPAVTAGDFRACDVFDVRDRLSAIRVPVLVITGEDDKLTPPAYGRFLAEKISSARSVHVMDAGHLVVVEKPEEVNGAIQRFLEEIGH